MSREKILSAIRNNEPAGTPMPDLNISVPMENPVERFSTTLVNIGGAVLEMKSWEEVHQCLIRNFPAEARKVTTIPELQNSIGVSDFAQDPHLLENVHVAILRGHFGVAENAAIWITEELMGDRALPFIAEHLVLVINKRDILPTLQQAYERIGDAPYEYGTFIAGPSKTADIEQSLVLGAHGPKSMMVVLMG